MGQLAGVTITADGGDPTSSPNIVIRGQGSQDGDNVLWVVDGVPGAPAFLTQCQIRSCLWHKERLQDVQ